MALAVFGLGAIASHRGKGPPDRVVIEQAVEDSLKLLSFEACKAKDPGAGFEPRMLVERAPGRWQVINRRKKDQLVCTAWQGKVQMLDTAIMQPGNGQLDP